MIAHATFAVTFLVLQIGLPLALLSRGYRERAITVFGWQMYAHDHRVPDLWYEGTDGARSLVPRERLPMFWQVGLGFRERFAAHLCRGNRSARAVIVHAEAPVAYTDRYACHLAR